MSRFVKEYLRNGARRGERNNTLFAASCAFRETGKTIDEAIRVLGARARNDGLDDAEIEATIRSAYSREGEPVVSRRAKQDREMLEVEVTKVLTGTGGLSLPEPLLNGAETYLQACFQADEFVEIALWRETEDGRIIPGSAGQILTCSEWIEFLNAETEPTEEELVKALVYVRVNPVCEAGNGTDESVTSYRHVLVEIDDPKFSKRDQYNLLLESGLPISAITDSANKSVHGLVRIDAPDHTEYERRCGTVYRLFKNYGLDSKNKNPSRYSRFPGGLRPIAGEKREQYLLAVNVGSQSWDEWQAANVMITEKKAKIDELLERTFWLSEKNRYYWRVQNETWVPLWKDDLANHLAAAGLFDDAQDAGESKAILNQFIRRVQEEHEIDWAGPLAGYFSGPKTLNGLRCLITRGVKMIEPKKGECSYLLDILQQLLPDGQHHYILARAKLFIESIRRQEGFRFSQAIVIVGERQCGKSLLANRILTPLIGDRQASATCYFNGDRFNDDLGCAEHWVVDDAGESKGFDRRVVSDGYKRAVAEAKVRIERKHIRAINVEIPRMVTVLSNSGTKNINLVPDLSEDNEDKVTLLYAGKVNLSTEPGAETNAKIAEQLPALAWYIEHEYKIPAEIRSNDRFGIKAYHHPHVLEMIKQTSTAEHLLTYVTSWMRKQNKPFWEGELPELWQSLLADQEYCKVVEKCCKSINSFSWHFGQLAKSHPDMVSRDSDPHNRKWRIQAGGYQACRSEGTAEIPGIKKIMQAAFAGRER